MQNHNNLSDVRGARKSAHLRIRGATHLTSRKRRTQVARSVCQWTHGSNSRLIVHNPGEQFQECTAQTVQAYDDRTVKPSPDYYVSLVETVRTEAPVDTVAAVQHDELRLSKRRSA